MANSIDPQTLAALHSGYLSTQKQQQAPQKKKPAGNTLTNLLPAIGGGLGAVAGIPLDIFGGAGSIAGGAAGASLGEALKEHLLGQNLSAKQIGIQGVEGGALSAFNPLKALGGASTAAKGFVSAGADKATQAATKDVGSTIVDKAVTQGQAAQGRVLGTSAGKAAGQVVTPQDNARLLAIAKRENIPIGNGNTSLQAVQTKLDQYGKQIGDHFTANNTPLTSADTKTLAANFLTSLKTTDPGVLKQATVLANDLEKNVKDTKGLWEFRKALDTRIPDSKLAAGNNVLSDKMTAIKGLRQHISDQLGDIPGSSQYHDLSELKPLVAGEAQRLNNPGGGIAGRVFASGPAQKLEAQIGKAGEAVGTKLGGRAPGKIAQPVVPTNLADALQQASAKTSGQALPNVDNVMGRLATGSEAQAGKLSAQQENDLQKQFIQKLANDAKQRGVPLGESGHSGVLVRQGAAPSFASEGIRPNSLPYAPNNILANNLVRPAADTVPEDILRSASDATGQLEQGLPATSKAAQLHAALKGTATLPLRAAAAPLAYPGRSIAQVAKQGIGRGVGDLLTAQQGSPAQQPAQSNTSLTDALMQAQGGDQSQQQSQSPYSQDDLQTDIQRDPKNAQKYIEYYNGLDKIYNPTAATATSKPTAQQYGLANSGVQSLQELANMIQTNPDIISKNATPGQGIPLVGSLISNASGASGYHSLADNILQAIIHLQTGATATKEETTAARGQLPQPGDSEAVRQQKLQTLLNDFAPFLGGAQ